MDKLHPLTNALLINHSWWIAYKISFHL